MNFECRRSRSRYGWGNDLLQTARLFKWSTFSLTDVRFLSRVPEVIATRVGLLEAVAQAPVVEAEYQYEGEQAKAELNLAADPVLRGIYEFDLHRIPVARVELVEVFVASVSSMFRSNRFCLLCLSFSTTAETKLRRQSAERKVDYRD